MSALFCTKMPKYTFSYELYRLPVLPTNVSLLIHGCSERVVSFVSIINWTF